MVTATFHLFGAALRHPDASGGFGHFYDPSWLKLVRTSAAAADGFEGLAEVAGERIGGPDPLPAGLDLDGAVAAGRLCEARGGLKLFQPCAKPGQGNGPRVGLVPSGDMVLPSSLSGVRCHPPLSPLLKHSACRFAQCSALFR
jgi:hypothetical protein